MAAQLFNLSGLQGFSLAQYNMGLGVPVNQAQAALWYQLAADQGNAEAQFNLGVMFEVV